MVLYFGSKGLLRVPNASVKETSDTTTSLDSTEGKDWAC